MNKIWIGNGQLVLPDKIVPGGSVLLEGKKIAAVNVPCPPDARRVDVDGSYIMAGFVDIHVHGGGDSDFMDEDASAFPTIAKAHCAHGTTALCPTTMTCADSLLEKTIDLFLEADKEPENGAELLGLHLEGPYFSAASKGAQPIGEQRIPEREDLERILRRAKGSILRWDAAPELPPFWDGPPELPKPPKAKVGLLILYILFGLVICLPVTVALTGLALGIFVLGGAGIGLGALLASFCFLGMNVVADILLLAGAALVAAALGLLLLFFAVWFFLRGVVGFADLIIRKGRDWCYEHGEVDA